MRGALAMFFELPVLRGDLNACFSLEVLSRLLVRSFSNLQRLALNSALECQVGSSSPFVEFSLPPCELRFLCGCSGELLIRVRELPILRGLQRLRRALEALI